MQERATIATFRDAQRGRSVVMARTVRHPPSTRAARVRQEPQDTFDRSHASTPLWRAYAINESGSSESNEASSRTALLFTFVTSLLVWSLCPVSSTRVVVVDLSAANFATVGTVTLTTPCSDSWSAASQMGAGNNQKRFTPFGPPAMSTSSAPIALRSPSACCTARTPIPPQSREIVSIFGKQLPRFGSARDDNAIRTRIAVPSRRLPVMAWRAWSHPKSTSPYRCAGLRCAWC